MTKHCFLKKGAFVLVLLISVSMARAAEFKVDTAKSHIQVDVKATGHKFSGNLKKYSLKISGDADSLTPKAVALKWDFVDLLTDNVKRDKEMLSWLQHDKYSTGTFTLSSFSEQTDGTTLAKGKLEFHGVSKVIMFPVKTERKGSELTVSGEASIDYRDFDLGKIRMALVMTVNPVVKVRFKLVGRVQ